MNDLIAIAKIRRMLVEQGIELLPEDLETSIGQLSLWISKPRQDLDGQSPLQALATPEGERRLRQVLDAHIGNG